MVNFFFDKSSKRSREEKKLSMYSSWPCPIFLSVLLLWHELLSSTVPFFVHPQVDCHVICVTSWVAEFLNLDARLLILSGNILSENYPSFEQYSHLVNWQIFWRVENFRKCPVSCIPVVSEMQKLKYLWICFLSSCCCRMECKTCPFLLISVSLGLISNVPFVLLLPDTQTFLPHLHEVGEGVPRLDCLCTSDYIC